MPTSRPRSSDVLLRPLAAVLRAVRASQGNLRGKRLLKQRFDHRPDDVFISTFPKSGTTLVQMILYQLHGDGSMDIPHINAVVPWLEKEIRAGNHRFLATLPSPRLFKTHMSYEFLPRAGRIIYVYRDVREVFVSLYHQQCRMGGWRIPVDDFARTFHRYRAMSGNWFEHLKSWWPHRYESNVLFLTFDEMTTDRERTIRRIASFCGIPLDESQLPRILERCSIEYMRRHNDKFDPRLHQIELQLETFIRHGKTGRWAAELPAAHQAKLERQTHELARRLGCGAEDPFGFLAGSARPTTGPRAVPEPAQNFR